MKKTVSGLIMEHFIRYDSQDLYIGPVLDTVGKEFFKIHGRRPYDSIKVFQKLVEEGKLTMVSEGVYRYDPSSNNIETRRMISEEYSNEAENINI